MLLQIHEPGQTPVPHQDDDEVGVGIDLGTTHSLVAYAENSIPRILKSPQGEAIMPSIVAYLHDKTIVGTEAKDWLGKEDGVVVSSIKKLMGRGKEDIRQISGNLPYEVDEAQEGGMVRLKIGNKKLTPVEISAEILKTLKDRAEEALSREVKKAVITVPAYFDDAARAATRDAARLAGLEVLRLVNEPTAAAFAYGLDQSKEGVYAVYDLGGGTFDISILKMEKGVFRVLSTGGHTALGGDDFDREVVELLLWQYKNQTGKSLKPSSAELTHLLHIARSVKEELSEKEEVNVELPIEGNLYDFKLTRAQLNEAITPYINATIDLCEQALDDADIELSDIQGVVLVGGSTRLPLVIEKAKEYFGTTPHADVNPDEVVALGAALQAEGLTKGSDNLLLDVLPLSLAMETMGGLAEKVIHRNTPIPVSRAQEFTTYQDGQTGMKFHIVQGEREMAEQNRSLARFELKGIPPMNAGVARVKVTFTVDADGLLTVSAREESTGTAQHIEVKPSYGLSDEEVMVMLRGSMAHAKEDMEARMLAEAKVEAARVLHAVESGLESDGHLIEPSAVGAIEVEVGALKKALEGNEREVIKSRQDALEQVTREFAALRMEAHMREALKGKEISDMGE